jgi:hypothetical protein
MAFWAKIACEAFSRSVASSILRVTELAELFAPEVAPDAALYHLGRRKVPLETEIGIAHRVRFVLLANLVSREARQGPNALSVAMP